MGGTFAELGSEVPELAAVVVTFLLGFLTWITTKKSGKIDETMKIIKSYDSLVEDLLTQNQNNSDKLSNVQSEFKNDGNGSLRSAIDEIKSLAKDLSLTLAKQQARIFALQNAQDIALYEIDEHGNMKYVNAAFADLYDLTVSQAMAGDWIKKINEEDLHKINQSSAFSQNAKQPWSESWTIYHDNGRKTRVLCRAYPILSAGGVFNGFAGSIVEVERL